MAVTSSSLRLKRIRRRFGIGAPKLAIKAYVAWYWKVLALVVVVCISLALAAWLFEAGKGFAVNSAGNSVNEVIVLTRRVIELDTELAKLRSQANSGENNLQIERATLKQLSRQVKSLELENTSLKEDLTFFEGLMPSAAGNDESVRIEHFRVEPDTSSGEYRYRMLVINSGQAQKKDFKGRLQFLVKVKREGADATITIPSDAESSLLLPQYQFESKYFRRLEGSFTLPPMIVVLGVEARLLQDDEVRAKRYVVL